MARAKKGESCLSFYVQAVIPAILVKPIGTWQFSFVNISPLTNILISLSN